MIPHSRPWITDGDRCAVADVLQSEQLAEGERCATFERAFADWLGSDVPGVAVGSGRAAVHLALRALRVTSGDEVVLPTYVCHSLLHAVRATGAVAVPCDVGEGWVVTPETIARHLTPRTAAVIVPHIYGIFADTAACKQLGVPIVEDFAQAVDGCRRRPMGGDLAVCSFHPTKCLTAGEGGMVIALDEGLGTRARELRDGLRPELFSPMSDMAAALALSQLRRYEDALRVRAALAARYRDVVAGTLPDALARHGGRRSMGYRFPLTLRGGLDRWQASFADRGVAVRRGVDHLIHRELGLPDHEFPTAVELFETTVSVPIYPSLSDHDLQRCLAALQEICDRTRTVTKAAAA